MQQTKSHLRVQYLAVKSATKMWMESNTIRRMVTKRKESKCHVTNDYSVPSILSSIPLNAAKNDFHCVFSLRGARSLHANRTKGEFERASSAIAARATKHRTAWKTTRPSPTAAGRRPRRWRRRSTETHRRCRHCWRPPPRRPPRRRRRCRPSLSIGPLVRQAYQAAWIVLTITKASYRQTRARDGRRQRPPPPRRRSCPRRRPTWPSRRSSPTKLPPRPPSKPSRRHRL